ncbi:hypothetical protein VNO77_15961 [Canavalia gladiata]|uniref:Zinc finger A20 and AN1 domain-containing stress-associated protein 4 n=1 Tax=Canavalia gladiata TaxID=3824 RepID=A0AAN9M4M7_CANGL
MLFTCLREKSSALEDSHCPSHHRSYYYFFFLLPLLIPNLHLLFFSSTINQVQRGQIQTQTMAEEHRCQTPEGHRLCTNNCGFFGSPATMNLCSKCYGDIRLKEQEEASTKSTIENALSSAAAVTVTSPPLSTSSPSSPIVDSVESLRPAEVELSSVTVGSVPVPASAQPNRCAMCRKRVGLTGFKCRCGVTFCGAHRYPEKHACNFDFKTVGREEIARANPVIKAEKVRRI